MNPYESAGIFSRICFWWVIPLIIKGRKKDLENEDLYKNTKELSSQSLGDALQREWNKELEKENPSLFKCLVRVFGSEYLMITPIVIMEECVVTLLQGYFVGEIIEYFDKKNEANKQFAYISAAAICLMQLLFVFFVCNFQFYTMKLDTKIRVSCSSILYRKALRLNQISLETSNIGEMVNLLSNDLGKFDNISSFSFYIITSLIQVIIIMLWLWQYLGYSILVGISVITFYLLVQIKVGQFFSKLRLKIAKLSDKRLYLVNELMAGMRTIKMYTWEFPFASTVEKKRREEVENIKKSVLIYGVPFTSGLIFMKLILFFTFLTFVLSGGKLTANVVFLTVILSFYLFRTMLYTVTQGVIQISEALVSMKRLQKFLLLPENDLQNKDGIVDSRHSIIDKFLISMENIHACWRKEMNLTLEGITLQAKPGELIGVVGSVGSGKTSLLMAILGEIPIISGNVKVKGRIAYTSQEAWVFSGTIRENILFGAEYSKRKYQDVLHFSSLEKDISLFPDGDLTLVGERGVIMSGGQKARINLARALYIDADIYILDDPLSAVDTPVAKHIFEKCIMEYLKTEVRILVTNQIHFLKSANKIIVLKEGKSYAIEDYNQLTDVGLDIGISPEKKETDEDNDIDSAFLSFLEEEPLNSCKELAKLDDWNNLQNKDDEEKITEKSNQNIEKQKENTLTDRIRANVFRYYINAGSGKFLQFIVLCLFIIFQVLSSSSDYWLVMWTKKEEIYITEEKTLENIRMNNETNTNTKYSEYYKMYVYLGLICGLILLFIIISTTFISICLKSSISLHNRMLQCIISAPISFLDNTPIGNVLSRFSKDLGVIDVQLPTSSLFFTTIIFNIVGIYVVEIIISPYLAIPASLSTVSIYLLWNFYFATASSLKRLEGLNRSPAFSHLSNSLYGLITIRAFKTERNLEVMFDVHQDMHTSSWFLMHSSRRSIIFCLHLLFFLNLCVTVVTVFLVSKSLTGSELGLVVCYGIILTRNYFFLFDFGTEIKCQLGSVERVMECSKLSSEAIYRSKSENSPSPEWPKSGNIQFVDVCLQYSENIPPVLKNLSFSIKSGEKVGIVGRTGAGKTSITAALLRMTEPTGIIIIDGIDIRDIGLYDLRSKISIIPQDPLLFSYSVRKNLDPFSKYTDDTLWIALEQVHLKDTIQNLPGGLDTELAEQGRNFSVGQRQLICLARVLLNKNKIIVLDEATASIDKQTDLLIQETIREKFHNCTVLTIAHRLQTIMDSDRVMVLKEGQIAEFDEPPELLKVTEGIFYNMVQMAGTAMKKQLLDIDKRSSYDKTDTENKNKDENEKSNEVNFCEKNLNNVNPEDKNYYNNVINE